ncbi:MULTISPECIES: hypothetical protein [unclassified Luteococcus]|uniref:hypothetical protein n=1 Tax=unclassified Luteococcus TaxID=2639923 RepID=UPI00313EE44C
MSQGHFPIDRLHPTFDDWTDDQAQALDKWYQGALCPSIPLGWYAPSGLDGITSVEGFDASDWLSPEGVTEVPAGAIVVSQTCDIVLSGPGRRHPFVQVSPVWVMPRKDLSQLADLQRWRVVDKVLLDPPAEGFALLGAELDDLESVAAIADLRISMPVSKSVLLAHQPVKAFCGDDAALKFAGHLATKAARPALPDVVAVMGRVLDEEIRGLSGERWMSSVESVRVTCSPSRQHAEKIRLLVLHTGSGQLPGEVYRHWDRLWKRVRKNKQVRAFPAITLGKPEHLRARDLLATSYRDSDELRLQHL